MFSFFSRVTPVGRSVVRSVGGAGMLNSEIPPLLSSSPFSCAEGKLIKAFSFSSPSSFPRVGCPGREKLGEISRKCLVIFLKGFWKYLAVHGRNTVQLAEFELSSYAAGKKGTKNQNGKRSSGLIFHISAPGFLEVGGSIRCRAQTLHFPTLWHKKTYFLLMRKFGASVFLFHPTLLNLLPGQFVGFLSQEIPSHKNTSFLLLPSIETCARVMN